MEGKSEGDMESKRIKTELRRTFLNEVALSPQQSKR